MSRLTASRCAQAARSRDQAVHGYVWPAASRILAVPDVQKQRLPAHSREHKENQPDPAHCIALCARTHQRRRKGDCRHRHWVLCGKGAHEYLQSTEDAKRFYTDKLAYLDENLAQLQQTIERKQDNMRVVSEVMQVVRGCLLETSPAAVGEFHVGAYIILSPPCRTSSL